MEGHSYFGLKGVIQGKKYSWLMDQPESIPEPWNLTKGVSLATTFPEDIAFPIEPKSGDFLADIVPNTLNILIVSPLVRTTLQEQHVQNVEFLPIIILDKKGQIKRDDYSIANLVGTISCLDENQSLFDEDPLEQGQITSIQKLTLLEKQIPADAKLFRLAQKRNLFIVRDDLLKSLAESSATGIETFAMGDDVFII